MKLHILGTCSGTEPMPDRHHVSFALEYHDRLNFFDAGEACSYTAHLKGLDLRRTRRIVISHTHMDHVGGLPTLLSVINKLDHLTDYQEERTIDLYIPEIRSWEGMYRLLTCRAGGFSPRYTLTAQEYADGLLFDEDGLRVTALHNHHLPHEEGEPWRSFGFLIEAEGKRIVYSGDTGGVADYAAFLPCDLLLMETGHHQPLNVVKELNALGLFPGKLAFIHHGLTILNHYEEQKTLLREAVGDRAVILEDYATIEL